MSRKLPLCAWCGFSLVGKGRLNICLEKEPGRPEVGWHTDCAEDDPLFAKLINENAPYEGPVAEIWQRGMDRVGINKCRGSKI